MAVSTPAMTGTFDKHSVTRPNYEQFIDLIYLYIIYISAITKWKSTNPITVEDIERVPEIIKLRCNFKGSELNTFVDMNKNQ